MKFYFDWRKLTRTFTHLINSWYEREIGETNLKSHAWSKRWSFECILMVFFPQKSGDSKRSWNPNLSWYMIYCQCKDTHYSIGVSTVQSFFLKPSTKDRHFKHGQSACVPLGILKEVVKKPDSTWGMRTFGWCLQIEGLISARLVGEDLVEIL